MLKRLAALLFVFVIAGQVSAGVCGCFSGETRARHSCCKSKKATGDAMRPTTCCDKDCIVRSTQTVTQDRTEPAAKIKFKGEAVLDQFAAFYSPARVTTAAATTPSIRVHFVRYPRPPDLYLRHHAFLI
jgi:hypothetical protein